jgi:hypothetical protein
MGPSKPQAVQPNRSAVETLLRKRSTLTCWRRHLWLHRPSCAQAVFEYGYTKHMAAPRCLTYMVCLSTGAREHHRGCCPTGQQWERPFGTDTTAELMEAPPVNTWTQLCSGRRQLEVYKKHSAASPASLTWFAYQSGSMHTTGSATQQVSSGSVH